MKLINFFLAILTLFTAPLIAQDIEGSSDHPIVGRYEGSTIAHYEQQDYGEADFIIGRIEGDQTPESKFFEGSVTKISYIQPSGSSALQVLRSFRQQLEKAGFTVEFECQNTNRDRAHWCGPQVSPAGTWLPSNNYKFENLRLFYATRNDDNGQIWIQITGAEMRNGTLGYSVVIVEDREFENKIVDVEAVTNELTEFGKMAFYDIHFETGSSDLKPESDATIKLIADVIADDPQLNVIVVGHTDNEGTLDFNIDLSRARAAVVEEKLKTIHGVAPERISSAGVAFLAPVSTNKTTDGRALNRRVEIVVR